MQQKQFLLFIQFVPWDHPHIWCHGKNHLLKIISRFSKYKKLVGNMKDFLVCLLQFNEIELKDEIQVVV
jgi:hypothetical protein